MMRKYLFPPPPQELSGFSRWVQEHDDLTGSILPTLIIMCCYLTIVLHKIRAVGILFAAEKHLLGAGGRGQNWPKRVRSAPYGPDNGADQAQ